MQLRKVGGDVPGQDPRYPLLQDDQHLPPVSIYSSTRLQKNRVATFKPVYTETIDTHLLPRQGVSDGHAFMDNIPFDRSCLGCRSGLIRLDQLDERSSLLVSLTCSYATMTRARRGLTIVTCRFKHFDTFVHCRFGVPGTILQLWR